MALLDFLLLVATEDRTELEAFGLLGEAAIPLLIEENPKLKHDPEVQPSDVAVEIVEVGAATGTPVGQGAAVLARLLRGDLDGIILLLGRQATVKDGMWAFIEAQVEELARKRPAVIAIDPHDGAAALVERCAAISDSRARLVGDGRASSAGRPLSVPTMQQMQDRFREHLKAVARQKRSPSVAIGSLIVASSTGRLFLGRKLRGVGRRQLATVGGNLTKDGPIDAALEALLVKRLGAGTYHFGPLLACSVLTRGGVRFVDMTFLVIVPDENVHPDPEEFSEHSWYSLEDIDTEATELFEPVANAIAKYRHLTALEAVIDALAPLTCSVREALSITPALSRYTDTYPEHFRSPFYFESTVDPTAS